MKCNHGDPTVKCDGFFCDCACHSIRTLPPPPPGKAFIMDTKYLRKVPEPVPLYWTVNRMAWTLAVGIVLLTFLFWRL